MKGLGYQVRAREGSQRKEEGNQQHQQELALSPWSFAEGFMLDFPVSGKSPTAPERQNKPAVYLCW